MSKHLNENYALVIPAYNEISTIRDVTLRACQYLARVIVVDDGSTDGTGEAIEDLPVTLLRHDQNHGKAGSLRTGFKAAMAMDASAIVTMDADGQHSPEDIPKLISQAEKFPNHIIIGARERNWSRGLWHRICANRIADFWISWAAGYPIADSQSGFRVYPPSVIQQTRCKITRTRSFVFESEILIEGAKSGYQSIPILIQSEARKASRASYFLPVLDIMRITRMVSWKLISRGMYPTGLYRSLSEPSLGGQRRKKMRILPTSDIF